MSRPSLGRATVCLLILLNTVAIVPAFAPAFAAGTSVHSEPGQVREFLAAWQRIHQKIASSPKLASAPELTDSAALESYVLHDYLVAARLRRDLQDKPSVELDATIDHFLVVHLEQPVARPLQHEWLLSLAQRRRWDWFLARATDVSDSRLVCARLMGRLATGDTATLPASIIERWIQPQRWPEECAVPFAWAREQGHLSAELAESRTRAALVANNPRLAREFLLDVPSARAAPLLQWANLLENPKTSLLQIIAHGEFVEPVALEAGFTRLSQMDAEGAASLLPRLRSRPDMTTGLGGRLQRALALGEASSRDPDTLAAFALIPSEAVDDQVQESRVRAALWAGNFAQARAWIDAMPEAKAGLARWRYWRARALTVTNPEAAKVLFTELASLRDYYGYLAADQLHQRYQLNLRALPDDSVRQATLLAAPGLLRAHALYDCDLLDEAALEWAVALSGATAEVKVQAAKIAMDWGWYAEGIATLAQAGEWDDVRLRYPRPYSTAVLEASQLTGLSGDWIYAVMRQESLFRKDVVSHANARGLMQLLPVTAKKVARRWHLAFPNTDSLTDPNVNLKLGAAYLRELLDRYNQHLALALAAYNAGPSSVARWLPHHKMDADIWIENIPYNETRGYVQHILEHIVAFTAVRDADLPRISDWLPPVGPDQP